MTVKFKVIEKGQPDVARDGEKKYHATPVTTTKRQQVSRLCRVCATFKTCQRAKLLTGLVEGGRMKIKNR